MAKGKKSSLAIAKETKRNSPQKLGKFETWVHRTMDYFTGVDSFNDKGEYIGHILNKKRLTPKQFKELEEINPNSAKEYKESPKKWWSKMLGLYKGGVVKKKMNMGGMMDDKKINPTTGMSMSMGGLSGRKVNPSTGLSMKKGGMIDYRKTGMMYGGGMARKR